MYLKKPSFVSLNLIKNGIHEKTETEFVMSKIKVGDVVIDIGANIGYYTLIFAKLVGEQGKVFAFEPEPSNFYLLKKNVMTNKYNNVILEEKAVSNYDGQTKLFLSNSNAGAHRIYFSHRVTKNYVQVKVTTLDDYFKNHELKSRISFIKIDVEGAELGTLEGLKTLLETNKKIIIMIEFDPQQIKEFGSSSRDLLNFLDNQKFRFLFVDQNMHQIKKAEGIDFLLKKYEESKTATNLICYR